MNNHPDLSFLIDDLHLSSEQQQRIAILELRGLIFLGSANHLVQKVRQRLHLHKRLSSQPPLRFLVLDFEQVSSLDPSAVLSFTKIKQISTQHNIQLVFTHLAPPFRHQLQQGNCYNPSTSDIQLFPTLRQGLIWCAQHLSEID
jgi:SulP family sulfate permease